MVSLWPSAKSFRFWVIAGALWVLAMAGLLARHRGWLGGGAAQAKRELEVRLTKHRLAPATLRASETDAIHTVRFGEPHRQLLFLLLPNCPACIATRPIWERLARQAPVGSVSAISLDSMGDHTSFFRDSAVPMWLVSSPDTFVSHFLAEMVPTTLVVDSGGRVRLVRVGILTQRDAKRIAALMRRDEE